MNQSKVRTILCCSAIVFVALGLSTNVCGQTLSQFCRTGPLTSNDNVLLEVKRIGKGMTWPLLPQLFLRVYENGRIQYEVRDGRRVVSKKGKIDSLTIRNLKGLLAASDLVDPRPEYSMLESVRDALMKTCVTYSSGTRSNQVLLVNYMPDHPRAKGYYPDSLLRLLEMVEDVRPSSEYERKYGFDKLSF